MIKELAADQKFLGLVPNGPAHIGIRVAQIGRPLASNAIDELFALCVPQASSLSPHQFQVALVVGARPQLFFQMLDGVSAGIGQGCLP